jgi:hypothetical protein
MRHKTIITAILIVTILACGWPTALFALTTEEVLKLKKAGVSEETIRMMIQQEKDGKRPATDREMGRREVREGDKVTVEYSTGRNTTSDNAETQQQQIDRAWEMLRDLRIDSRKTN